MVARTAGRKGRPWRRFRQLVLETFGPVCWVCRHPIDLGLHYNHPGAFTVHHLDPLSRGGAPMNLDRARPAHRGCNSALGNRTQITQPNTSRVW